MSGDAKDQCVADAKRRFPKAKVHLTDKIRDGGVWADDVPPVRVACPRGCPPPAPPV